MALLCYNKDMRTFNERMVDDMETGMKAWIANQSFPNDAIRIDLPGGWHWDVQNSKVGHLKTPEGYLCVGYDLKTNTIQFGKSGETVAPGLNLWTIQEMGEKFAREHFMSSDTAKEYDAFAKKRGEERRVYEKGVRDEMKGIITMELKDGKWTAHVDTAAVKDMTGIEVLSGPDITREAGVALFNQMSKKRCVMPLRDPMGYMVLENNVYDYIKDQYDFQYNDTIDSIDAGFINGNGYGCEKILDSLDAVVRKNIREYCLPDGVNYQDLRFITPTPEIEDAVGEFVKQRVTKTVNYEKKRDHTQESLEKDHEKFVAAADVLKEKIGDVALPPLDIPEIGMDEGIKM